MSEKSNVCAVVLAAGKGTRMKSELPKVATPLLGKPLILHVIDNLRKAEIDDIVVVVGYKKEVVQSLLKDYSNIKFAEQKEQLGTGHALLSTESILSNYTGSILVCCGDVPLISPISFKSLYQNHKKHENIATVLYAEIENPFGYGRLIRKDSILKYIVEEKDANDEEKLSKEINTGTYVFESPSVFEKLKSIGTNNAQGEYYLPDLIKIYNNEGQNTGAMKLLNYLESSGVNSPEDLQRLTNLLEEGKVTA
ncbi:MAG: NTP transferase domain-containing protein [Leptospiraceae bacterium]|nr:NTP transferase domain-containing protein [Leptospiraceae bacterium]